MKRKYIKMFLSSFPYSEVLSIIGILLSWIYIALGIIGNNQNHQQQLLSEQQALQQQKHQVDSKEITRTFESKCYWLIDLSQIHDSEFTEPFTSNSKPILANRQVKYVFQPFQFSLRYFNRSIPSRAPPHI